jgi:hypothetical protein
MDSVPQDRIPIAAYEAPDLAELLRLIRTGHTGATRQLRRLLIPGVLFLLRRRLSRNDVAGEAQCVLEAALNTIRTDTSVLPDAIPRMVRRLIQQQCAGQTSPDPVAGSAPPTVPASVLNGMSPVEREALRRCYVLGEAPESFVGTLRLTTQEFRAIRARARAVFSSRKAKTNVA